MAIASLTESYKVLRRETAWTLLAADTAPETLALLQTLLFHERNGAPARGAPCIENMH